MTNNEDYSVRFETKLRYKSAVVWVEITANEGRLEDVDALVQALIKEVRQYETAQDPSEIHSHGDGVLARPVGE